MRMDEQRVASIIEMELMVLDSPELIGFKYGDLVSKLWDYLKENNLQNPKDMPRFTPDKTLEAIFEVKANQECSMMFFFFIGQMGLGTHTLSSTQENINLQQRRDYK